MIAGAILPNRSEGRPAVVLGALHGYTVNRIDARTGAYTQRRRRVSHLQPPETLVELRGLEPLTPTLPVRENPTTPQEPLGNLVHKRR